MKNLAKILFQRSIAHDIVEEFARDPRFDNDDSEESDGSQHSACNSPMNSIAREKKSQKVVDKKTTTTTITTMPQETT